MFYPITSRAARRRKRELDVFGGADTAIRSWPIGGISPRDKRIRGD